MTITIQRTVRVGHRVTLTPSDLELAHIIGLERFERSRREGRINQRRVEGLEVEDDAVAAEMAFARLAGVTPLLEVEDPHHSADCILPDGRPCDVKHTRWVKGKLIAYGTHTDRGKIQVYALMVGNPHQVLEFRGWAWKHELIRPANITDLGKGKCFGLNQNLLHQTLSFE